MAKTVSDQLRLAYDRRASERDQKPVAPWKNALRQEFLRLLLQENRKSLLEIGGGPGHDALFFQSSGLEVTVIDLSPEMVRLCRAKGVAAVVMNVQELDFSEDHFDAVYSMNCLLHVPRSQLDSALSAIARVLRPGGLFFLGLYGGIEQEGLWADDVYRPRRHFTFYTDEQLLDRVSRRFTLRDFRAIEVPGSSRPDIHFQCLLLQKPPAGESQPLG